MFKPFFSHFGKVGMQSTFWSKFKWFFERILEFKKKAYPLSTLGARLILFGSPMTLIAIKVIFPPKFIIQGFEFTSNEISLISILPILVGCYLIHHELALSARNTARVIITGLPGVSSVFPTGLLSKSEQKLSRETVELSAPDSDIDLLIERYNAELCVDLFKRFVLQDGCQKLYIGGLARVPFLVAYGAFLRNVSNIVLFDKVHRDGNWRLLNDENQAVEFLNISDLPKPNENGDVGLAVAFSTVINAGQLPASLQKHTKILRPSITGERNLILNQENLQHISGSLARMIDALSQSSEVKLIHLFLSVQSSLAIEIGRRYQEGTHKKWVIHNFNANDHCYDWAVKLSNSGLSSFHLNGDINQ
tara:strand:- start:38189 stop:39277 length:1089 start_codon:yes stop_codon:yes gene_type:complete